MPRTQPPDDNAAVTKQLPGLPHHTRPETIEQWQLLMDAHDYNSAVLFARTHNLPDQLKTARDARDEAQKGHG